MAQYDIHRLAPDILVVDCQSNYIRLFDTRLVIPLMPPGPDAEPVTRLQPLLDVEGQPLILVTHLLASVPTSELGRPLFNLGEHGPAIDAALDMIITGF